MKSILPVRSLKGWRLSLFASLFCLAGCQLTSTGQLESESDPIIPQLSPGDECADDGAPHNFDISVLPTEGSYPGDYVAKLSTPPYFTAECMCLIDHYKITFTGIRPEDVVNITDLESIPLHPYPEVLSTGSETYFEVKEFEGFGEENLDILIFLDEAASPNTADGGGLCVIDNVGGIDPHVSTGLRKTTPWRITSPSSSFFFLPRP